MNNKSRLVSLDKMIEFSKSKVITSQGKLMSKKNGEEKEKQTVENDLIDYLKESNKIRQNIEQKIKIIQTEFEKQRNKYENKINQLQNELKIIKTNQKQKQNKIILLQKQINLSHVRQKQINFEKQNLLLQFKKLNQQINILKKDYTIVKLQNKNLRADNRVVVSHLSHQIHQKMQIPAQNNWSSSNKCIIDSLYQKTMPSTPLANKTEKISIKDNLSNKILLDDVLHEKQSKELQIQKIAIQLNFERKQKNILDKNYLEQQQLFTMAKKTNAMQENIIIKMQDKIDELQMYNKVLRQHLQKEIIIVQKQSI